MRGLAPGAPRGQNAGRMSVVASILRRCLTAPAVLPVLGLSGAAAFVADALARSGLGASEQVLADVRQGSLLFAGLLMLSLCEPLQVGREARGGILLLRLLRGGGFALLPRCLGLLLALLPALLCAALGARGLPAAPLQLLAGLVVLASGGLLLGAWCERGRLVAALWGLAVVGHLRPWLLPLPAGRVLAAALPDLAAPLTAAGLAHSACWSAGALLLAQWRLGRVAAGGALPGAA